MSQLLDEEYSSVADFTNEVVMKQMYPSLLQQDLHSIPCGMVRERQDMLQHLRSIHTIGEPNESMGIQELVYLLKEQPGMYPKHLGMYWEKRMKTLVNSGDFISMLSDGQLRSIVRAGFFYSGEGSTLTCYHCGCHVLDWQSDDNPWLRHAEIQPNCPIIKGNVHIQHRRESCSIMRRSMSCPC